MKKAVTFILITLSVLLVFTGCSGGEAEEVTVSQTTETEAVTYSADVDLTALSSTMVYSEVYNMMATPDDYIGKTVKMKGEFAVYTDEELNKNYYAAIISDATACCQQGLEFVLPGDKAPEGYTPGDEIEVIGTFETYREGELTYCHLTDASIL